MSVTVQILGHVAEVDALLRSGGRPGDQVFVSGTPGDAAAGLAVEQSKLKASARSRRISAQALSVSLTPPGTSASACELCEGLYRCVGWLLGDAGKLAQASGCGVELAFDDVPVSEELVSAVGEQRARELALTGGDDYELCFTVRPSDSGAITT